MKILITGADGYVGRALVAALARPRSEQTAPDRLLLVDRRFDPAPRSAHIEARLGDITDAGFLTGLFAEPIDVILHLAAVVSGAAEADFDLGQKVNLEATMRLLELARRQQAGGGPRVRFVFASSIAVYGTPRASMDDDTPPRPTLSYGFQKSLGESLIADYHRRGYIEGLSLRLPGIIVRPPLPNGALSAFMSDIVREPLAGRDYLCPVSPTAGVWVMSLATCVANLEHATVCDTRDWPVSRALTLPPLALSMQMIADAIARVAGADRVAAIRYAPQPALERDFGTWPLTPAFERARDLGFKADPTIDAIVRAHLAQR